MAQQDSDCSYQKYPSALEEKFDAPVPSDWWHEAGLWPRPRRGPRSGPLFWAGSLAFSLGLVEVGGAATSPVNVRDAFSLRDKTATHITHTHMNVVRERVLTVLNYPLLFAGFVPAFQS